MTKSYFSLSEGEGIVVQAAARIYAAYIISGKVRDSEEKQWMRRAFKEATSFAKTVDELDDDGTSGADAKPKPSADAPMPSRDELLEDMESAASSGDQAREPAEMGQRPLMEEMEDAGSDIDDVLLEMGEGAQEDANQEADSSSASKPSKNGASE